MSTELRTLENDLKSLLRSKYRPSRFCETSPKQPTHSEASIAPSSKRLLRRTHKKVFKNLGTSIKVDINGQTVEPDWVPVDSPVNAMASERFFVYFLETKVPLPKHANHLTVVLQNQAHLEEDMYLTGKTLSRTP